MRIDLKAVGLAVCCAMSLSGAALAQAPSTTCAGAGAANTIPAAGGMFSGTTSATSTATIPLTCSDTSAAAHLAVWYIYTPSLSGPATFSVCGGTTVDTVMSLYTSCTAGTNPVACDDDGCSPSLQSTITYSVSGGTMYFLRLARYSTSATNFTYTLTVTAPTLIGRCCSPDTTCLPSTTGAAGCPNGSHYLSGTCSPNTCAEFPANDDCAFAQVIPAAGGSITGTCAGATHDGDCICDEDGFAAVDVYYSFTPTIAGPWNIGLCATATNWAPIVSIHVTGCPVNAVIGTGAGNQVDGGCSEEFCSSASDLQFIPGVMLTPGVTYLIRVAPFSSDIEFWADVGVDMTPQAFTLTVTDLSSAPVTGRCCNAASGACTLLQVGSCPSGTTQDTPTTCPASSLCPVTNVCCIDATGECVVHYDTACTAGSSPSTDLTCSPSPCPSSGTCCVGAACTQMLDTNSGSCTGTYTPGLSCSPHNPCFSDDNCDTTTRVAAIAQNSGTSVNATDSFVIVPPSLCPADGTTSSGGHRDVFWKFTAPATAAFTLDTCGTAFDSVLSIHSGPCANIGDAASVVACNDDSSVAGNTACPANNFASRIQSVNLVSGTVYTIRVAGYDATDTGAYTLNVNYVNPAQIGRCCNGSTCVQTDDAGCTGVGGTNHVAGEACTPTTCSAGTEFCCRGTTCLSVPAGTCTGIVAASISTPVTACGPNNALATCCYADYDHSGLSTIDDLFKYINVWLTGSPYTKIGGNGTATPSIDDLFIFINMWLGGCTP